MEGRAHLSSLEYQSNTYHTQSSYTGRAVMRTTRSRKATLYDFPMKEPGLEDSQLHTSTYDPAATVPYLTLSR